MTAATLAAVAAIVPAEAGGIVRLGPELQVNTVTAGDQAVPDVAAFPDGGGVVVWESESSGGSDGSATSIQARLVAADGTPVGVDFQVNTHTPFGQHNAAVAAGPGTFVVVWDSDGSPGDDGSSFSIQARVFAHDGTPLGDQLQVNTFTAGVQRHPSVAVAADGGFAVVWHSFGSSGDDDSSASVQGRWFEADGTPVGPDVQLNTVTFHRQKHPAVAAAPDGSFLAVWQDEGTGTVEGRWFGAGGGALGGQVSISSGMATFQEWPRVAVARGGGALVVWEASQSAGGDGSGYSVQARWVGVDGIPAGVDLQVNTVVDGMQRLPAVAAGVDGELVAVWQSESSGGDDSSGTSVQARVVSVGGGADGAEVQVNAFVDQDQRHARIAGLPGGSYLVVWQSDGVVPGDGSGSAILCRRLETWLFRDGFESGDAAAWNDVVGGGL